MREPTADDPTPNTPRYRARADTLLQSMTYDGDQPLDFGAGPKTVRNFVPVPAGKVLFYLGWPNADLEPLNAIAREVAEYYGKFRNDPKLPSLPYDASRGGIYLPERIAP